MSFLFEIKSPLNALRLISFVAKGKKEEDEDDMEDLQRWAMEAM